MSHKASEFAPEDFISIMPDSVVSDILERLPLQDAVRTGILSRSWRFKWTMLRKLLFDDKFFRYLSQTKSEKDYGRIITMLLLRLKGPITKFVISRIHSEDINHWILFLSGKGIEDLTLTNWGGTQVKLSAHLFSCLELKHLKLHKCYVNPPPTFHGFPNLLSLELIDVQFGSAGLEGIFSRSPLLEVLNMSFRYRCPVKLIHVAKFDNLKTLSFKLRDVDTPMIISSQSIFELVGFLPKLQKLHLDFVACKLTEDGAKQMLSPTFPSLKALKLSRVDLGNGIMLSFVLEMIGRSLNLQTLEITAIQCDADPIPEIECNTTTLQSVVLTFFKGSENELCLIEYLLACSPILKKIVIHPDSGLDPNEQLVFTRKLLKLHRASTVAEIDF